MTAATTGFGPGDRQALVEGSAAIAATGMVVGSAGNLSLRSGDRVLITPRGAELGAIDPADLVQVSLADGTVAPDHASVSQPSSETPLHRSIYATGDAGAIVHTHAHYCTVLSALVDELPAVHYVITAFGGPVRVAGYETFGTDALAASVTTALRDRRAALMANHGAVVAGRDIEHAVALAIGLEWLASVYYHALCAGTPRILSDDQLHDVTEQAQALRYGLQETPA
ncbi:MAG TPA: class II aldolase/adducin family protein [Solirubrobacteraceae bacterium]